MARIIFERLKFLGAQGVKNYWRSGRRFFRELGRYLTEARRLKQDVGEVLIDARITDWDSNHPIRKSVFEAFFASEMVRQRKPSVVHDIGSDLVFVATLSSFIDVVVVDNRGIGMIKTGLTFRKSDARQLPFKDAECEFITSLCVIEHIGLGRYGDGIDPLGDKKFIQEIKRCLKPGGMLVLSMPVSKSPALVFNAHRVYSLDQIDDLSLGFSIVKEGFIFSGATELLSRKEALDLMSDGFENYMIWIGCLKAQ